VRKPWPWRAFVQPVPSRMEYCDCASCTITASRGHPSLVGVYYQSEVYGLPHRLLEELREAVHPQPITDLLGVTR